MRNRTALTTAVTSGAPEPPSRPTRDDLIFGKVAGPGSGGPGARTQDVEMFDAAPSPSPAPGGAAPRRRHGAGKPKLIRKASRSRRAEKAPEREIRAGGMSLPLLITGALAAGIGLTVGLTSEPEPGAANSLSLTMPDLPAPDLTPDDEPSATRRSAAAPTTTARTTTPPTAAPTSSAPSSAPPSGPGTPTRTPTPPPTSTPTPPATRTPDPVPTQSSRRPGPSDSGLLSLGSSGPEVLDLQLRLQQLYLYLGSADGTFGSSLEVALSRFQRARDIPEEPGVYGPLTRAALYAETHRPDRRDRHDRNSWTGDGDWRD
ncbi:peptidoglycan-binding domain-containing protein [Streptomyces tanashiensis]|uniref:peptidoglycan-binding domain-containing protein n=1 Tax=Streptomyces tanashiensis TaxID=67367 RepID=UPI0036C2DB00